MLKMFEMPKGPALVVVVVAFVVAVAVAVLPLPRADGQIVD